MSDTLDKTQINTGEASDQDGNTLQFLTFTVRDEDYGVDIMTVREIKGWTETTRLPNSPTFMRGVMNLRGLVIPIFDLRARFHRELTQATAKHVIIILAVGKRTIGILVDAVSDILTVNEGDIKPKPEMDVSTKSDFISGLLSLENRMVVLLTVDQLFHEESIKAAPLAAA